MAKYLRLARITAWPASLFSFAVGFGAGADRWTQWEDVLFGFLAVFSFFSFAFALNFYSDKDVDRYHEGWQKDVKLSRQPLLSGDITERECKVFCVVTFMLTIAFAWLVSSLVAWLMFGACLAGGILYSYPPIRLKGKPLGDILCMSGLSALLFPAGYVVAQEVLPTWQMFLFFAMFSAIVYIPTVISDYEYDSKAGLKTSAVVFGQRNLAIAMWVILSGAAFVAWLIVSGAYPFGAKLCVVLACVASAIYAGMAWRGLRPPRLVMPVLSRYSRQAILGFGIVSLLFGGWGLFKLFY